MHARKIRDDESFISKGDQKDALGDVQTASITSRATSYVPSPARQLQQQLEDQFQDTVTVKPVGKYSGLVSLSIIVGSSSLLWLGMFALAMFVYK